MKWNPGYIKQCKTNTGTTGGLYILREIINTHESLENNQGRIKEHKQEKQTKNFKIKAWQKQDQKALD